MKQAIKCFIKLHNYEVYKEEILTDIRKEIIGTVIVCRCKYCGKLKIYKVYTKQNSNL